MKITSKLINVNATANSPHLTMSLTSADIELILAELGIEAKDTVNMIQKGHHSDYIPLGNGSFSVDKDGLITGFTVFRNCKFDKVGDTVELETGSVHQKGDLYKTKSGEDKPWKTLGFDEASLFNNAVKSRKSSIEDERTDKTALWVSKIKALMTGFNMSRAEAIAELEGVKSSNPAPTVVEPTLEVE